MKCILCGEELEAYGASASYVYCNADYCDLYNVVMSIDAAKKLESIAQTSASNQWVSAQFQQWARNYIAELCEERDDARKWAKEYKRKYEEEVSDPIDEMNDIISEIAPEFWEEAKHDIFCEGNFGWHMVFRQMLMIMKDAIDEN